MSVAIREYNPAEPWVRQPCDTDLSWDLFQAFLALPTPRRLVDLVKRASGHGLSWARLQELAWEDGWGIRAECWDSHLDRLRVETIEQVTREDARARAERQGALARKLQRLGELEADKLLKASQGSDMPGLLLPRDMIRAITLGVRTERLALGESTEKVDTGPDLSGLSVDELRTMRALQERVGNS